MPTNNHWLTAAAMLSGAAALLHLACIVGGAPWYRALGAGEHMARAAERGAIFPVVITLFIAIVLLAWMAFALSGAGVIPRLPLTRTALVAICGVLMLRGLGLPLMQMSRPDLSAAFLYTTAAIVTLFGIIFIMGTVRAWPMLSLRG
jgi:hypothetical protein